MDPEDYKWLTEAQEDVEDAETHFCEYDDTNDTKIFRLSLLSALIGINKAMVEIRDELRKLNDK